MFSKLKGMNITKQNRRGGVYTTTTLSPLSQVKVVGLMDTNAEFPSGNDRTNHTGLSFSTSKYYNIKRKTALSASGRFSHLAWLKSLSGIASLAADASSGLGIMRVRRPKCRFLLVASRL